MHPEGPMKIRWLFLACLFCYIGVGTADLAMAAEEEPVEAAGLREAIVEFARELIGAHYCYGHASPEEGFDCSGFTMYVFSNFGYPLPHGTADQMKLGERIGNRQDLAVADLVFFATTPRKDYPSHVGIYLGDGKFIHAPSTGKKVCEESLSASYYVKRFLEGRRILEEDE
jgi:peptidoglycan DL-endopeptidase CwlO